MRAASGRPGAAARGLLLPLFLLLAGASAAPASVAGQSLPPDERWRILETPHFRVTFPAGLDSLAVVAAARAEKAWETLSSSWVRPPDGRVELVLTDHADFSNGSARVAPYNRIIVFARPPVDGFALSHFDDWLELVVTHELVHIFHLDLGGGIAPVLRTLFGRVPSRWPFFPEAAAPGWIIEGLATWQESALTESGRVRGTQHDMILRTALLEGAFEDIGQTSGNSPVWPGGARAYIYGSLFFDYLARKHGELQVAEFVRAVAGQWIPYRLNAAARSAFGVSFSDAWSEWEGSLAGEIEALRERLAHHAPLTTAEAVTQGARQAYYAQISPDGGRLLFARADGHSDTQLRVAALDGSQQERLTRTNGLSVFSWTPDGGVLYAQYHLDGPYRTRSELHLRTPDGRDRRLTESARVDHPSAAPDGRTAVAIRVGPGRSELVEVDLTSGALRPLPELEPDADWAFPRVSPDGRWIAASRWRRGAFFDVVLLDRSGRLVAEVTDDRALDIAPAWSSDGRWLLWGSDRNGVPNLLAASVDPATGRPGAVRQVTNVLTGAAFPSVDPAGRWIYFSGYHASGWEVERIPFDPSAWSDPQREDPRFAAEEPYRAPVRLLPIQAKGYSPLHTLRPRYWEPEAVEPRAAGGRSIIGTALGFRTAAEDVVGRHRIDLRTTVATTGEWEGELGYRWARLGNPVVSVGVDQRWDVDGPLLGERPDGTRDTLWLTERERGVSAAATYRMPGFRTASTFTLSGGVVWEARTLLGPSLEPTTLYRLESPSARVGDLRASWSVSTARSHALSIGTAQGVSLLLQGRRRVHLALADSLASTPRDRSFDELLARLQAYSSFRGPGFAEHVLALRVSGGVAGGPAASGSHFRVGGASGGAEPITGYALFGATSLFFPARGYDNGARRGRYAVSSSAEYRFPLALLNRGLGLFPLHLDQMSGSLFADAGNAWGAPGGANPRGPWVASAGAELLVELLTFYDIPVLLRTGVALPLVEADPARGSGRGPTLYLRFGRPF